MAIASVGKDAFGGATAAMDDALSNITALDTLSFFNTARSDDENPRRILAIYRAGRKSRQPSSQSKRHTAIEANSADQPTRIAVGKNADCKGKPRHVVASKPSTAQRVGVNSVTCC